MNGAARRLIDLTEDDLRAVVRDEMARVRQANDTPHLTVDEAANFMRRSSKTIRRYLACGRLKGTRIAGGTILVERASIEKLISR